MKPTRRMLEQLKAMAERGGLTLEQAADLVDAFVTEPKEPEAPPMLGNVAAAKGKH